MWNVNNENVYLIAHNNYRFDELVLKKEYERCNRKIPNNFIFIDTLPLCRNLLPLSNYRLSTFNHYFNMNINVNTHTAEGDIELLIKLWDNLIKIKDIDFLINKSLSFRKYIDFGKYKNNLIENIPNDYIDFIIKYNIFDNRKYLHYYFLENNKYYNSIHI